MGGILRFIIKFEFWVLILLALGMYVGEWLMGIHGLGNFAFVLFLIAITRLAMHPMWKKGEEQAEDE